MGRALGTALLLRVEKIETLGARAVEDIIVAVEAALKIQPWTFWPNPPCLTPERFFLYTAGIGCGDIIKLITAYRGEIDVVRQLRIVAGISPMQGLMDAWTNAALSSDTSSYPRVLPGSAAA